MIRILYFTAEWCRPCKGFGPVLTREAEARGLTVERVDINSNTTTPRVHGVMSVPTVIVLRDGVPSDRFGNVPASVVRAHLDALTGDERP